MVFFGGNFGFECFWPFPFLFLFSVRRTSHRRTGFGWQSKGEDHFRSWFPFFLCLLGDNFVFVQMSSGPKTFLYISFVFFWSLIGNFLSFFCFLPLFDWEFFFFMLYPFLWLGIFLLFVFSPFLWLGIFLLFVSSSEGKDWYSHPGSRFMVSWDFGSRLLERLDMIYVRFWFGSGIKGDVPHYFHDTNATMMIWKFYAKLVMHAPMRTLKCQTFMVMWC